jgi:general secretion pathway protein E
MIAGNPPKSVAPVGRLPFAFAKRHGVLVRAVSDGKAQVVYRQGAHPSAVAELRRFLGIPLVIERVNAAVFDDLLRKAYEGGSGEAGQIVEGIEGETDLAGLAEGLPEPSDLLESEDDAPIIRLINAVLTQAIKENASDIHVEPYENRLVVRFRVDGVMREVLQTKRAVAPLLISRIKVAREGRTPRPTSVSGRATDAGPDLGPLLEPLGVRRPRADPRLARRDSPARADQNARRIRGKLPAVRRHELPPRLRTRIRVPGCRAARWSRVSQHRLRDDRGYRHRSEHRRNVVRIR